jgi:hypothetical protein
MKKLTLSMAVLFSSLCLCAQYKKASFFGKEGRTYEIGSQMYNFGDGKGSPIGFKIAFGSDQDGKQFFSAWELQYIPSYKYSFTTTDENTGSVLVSGKSKNAFVYAVNYGYHLLKNDESERKVKPYVTAGFNIVISSGVKTQIITPDDSYNLQKGTSDEQFNFGLSGGLGCMVNFTQKFGLRLQGGYNFQVPIGGDEGYDEVYRLFTSHTYISAGLRLRIAAK